MYRMKLTALIDDELIETVREISEGKTTTESVVIALREWVALKKLTRLANDVKRKPLKLSPASYKRIRELNRKQT